MLTASSSAYAELPSSDSDIEQPESIASAFHTMKEVILGQQATAALITFTFWHARKLTTPLVVRHKDRALPRSSYSGKYELK